MPAFPPAAPRFLPQPHSSSLISADAQARAWSRQGKLALMAVLAASVLSGCDRSGAASGPQGAMPPPEVNVVTVHAHDLPVAYEYVGQTAGSSETEVRARVSGILESRLFVEGSRVKAGTPLFQIDPGTYRTQLAAAEAAAAVAEARMNQARREYARLAPLAQEKAISQKEYDDAKSTLEIAEATLKQTRAQVNEASLNLGYTKVVAPIAGITGTATKANGSMITANDSLLTTLVQTDPMYVSFSVTESDYLKLNSDISSGAIRLPGKRADNGSMAFVVKLKLADGSIYPLSGRMNFASEKINPASGGFEVRAQVSNPDGNLRPGQFVRVMLAGASRSHAIAIPQRAVIDSPNGKIVFTVSNDNKLQPHPVELDGWSNGEWIVTKGLQDGDRVLVDGFIKAHNPGMTVKPVALPANGAAASANARASALVAEPGASAGAHDASAGNPAASAK